jgi:hypothetical protein
MTKLLSPVRIGDAYDPTVACRDYAQHEREREAWWCVVIWTTLALALGGTAFGIARTWASWGHDLSVSFAGIVVLVVFTPFFAFGAMFLALCYANRVFDASRTLAWLSVLPLILAPCLLAAWMAQGAAREMDEQATQQRAFDAAMRAKGGAACATRKLAFLSYVTISLGQGLYGVSCFDPNTGIVQGPLTIHVAGDPNALVE